MATSKKLQKARAAKNDEFYTRLSDIEKECSHYKKHFHGKVILCNCDDPRVSDFFKYFAYNFERLGLKKLITTCYKNQNADLFTDYKSERAVLLEYTGDKNGNKIPDADEIDVRPLSGDGDFRSPECIDILKQADIVVTNPPFSLFREYLDILVKHNKKFLIIGNKNAISYKETFQLIKENKIWAGVRSFAGGMWFYVAADSDNFDKIEDGKKLKNVPAIWLTNLDHDKRHQVLPLYKVYKGHESEFPHYDNYDAINVGKTSDIPMDYDGVMGVPITFLDKHNPDQFEILGMDDHRLVYPEWRGRGPNLNGKPVYRRIIIRKKQEG